MGVIKRINIEGTSQPHESWLLQRLTVAGFNFLPLHLAWGIDGGWRGEDSNVLGPMAETHPSYRW